MQGRILPLQQRLEMEGKRPQESIGIATHIVLPDDTNTLGNLMGGRLMYWMDVIAAVSAHQALRSRGGHGLGEQHLIQPTYSPWATS